MTQGIKPDAFLSACPSRQILARVGEKWSLLALASLEQGPKRFGEIGRTIEGVSQKMLTQSLRNLEQDGLVKRKVYDEMPLRVEYSLTPMGREITSIVMQLKLFVEKNLNTIQGAE
jgi:DNA-binding HxlR family transcriptional regulator